MGADLNAQRAADSEIYKAAMRKIVSPVAVVTAQKDGARNGLTATAVCSATTAPPTMIVCINRKATALGLIAAAQAFAVNFASDDQAHVARGFSERGLDGETRMARGEWRSMETGAPILLGAIASFDCSVTSMRDCGIHTILIGQVVAVSETGGSALLYSDGYFRQVAPA